MSGKRHAGGIIKFISRLANQIAREGEDARGPLLIRAEMHAVAHRAPIHVNVNTIEARAEAFPLAVGGFLFIVNRHRRIARRSQYARAVTSSRRAGSLKNINRISHK